MGGRRILLPSLLCGASIPPSLPLSCPSTCGLPKVVQLRQVYARAVAERRHQVYFAQVHHSLTHFLSLSLSLSSNTTIAFCSNERKYRRDGRGGISRLLIWLRARGRCWSRCRDHASDRVLSCTHDLNKLMMSL